MQALSMREITECLGAGMPFLIASLQKPQNMFCLFSIRRLKAQKQKTHNKTMSLLRTTVAPHVWIRERKQPTRNNATIPRKHCNHSIQIIYFHSHVSSWHFLLLLPPARASDPGSHSTPFSLLPPTVHATPPPIYREKVLHHLVRASHCHREKCSATYPFI